MYHISLTTCRGSISNTSLFFPLVISYCCPCKVKIEEKPGQFSLFAEHTAENHKRTNWISEVHDSPGMRVGNNSQPEPQKRSSYSIQKSGYISPFSTNLCQLWPNAPQTRGNADGQDFNPDFFKFFMVSCTIHPPDWYMTQGSIWKVSRWHSDLWTQLQSSSRMCETRQVTDQENQPKLKKFVDSALSAV